MGKGHQPKTKPPKPLVPSKTPSVINPPHSDGRRFHECRECGDGLFVGLVTCSDCVDTQRAFDAFVDILRAWFFAIWSDGHTRLHLEGRPKNALAMMPVEFVTVARHSETLKPEPVGVVVRNPCADCRHDDDFDDCMSRVALDDGCYEGRDDEH